MAKHNTFEWDHILHILSPGKKNFYVTMRKSNLQKPHYLATMELMSNSVASFPLKYDEFFFLNARVEIHKVLL
jgi:hypothetical protein